MTFVQPDSDDSLAVAYHEAGHCVAAYKNRIPFTGRVVLSIIPTDEYRGLFVHRCILPNLDIDNSDRSRLKMERYVKALLAGIEAERFYDESSIQIGEGFGNWDGGADYHEAVETIDKFTSGPRETELYLELLRHQTENLVRSELNWICIQALADRLAESKTLSAVESKRIIQSTIDGAVARHNYVMNAVSRGPAKVIIAEYRERRRAGRNVAFSFHDLVFYFARAAAEGIIGNVAYEVVKRIATKVRIPIRELVRGDVEFLSVVPKETYKRLREKKHPGTRAALKAPKSIEEKIENQYKLIIPLKSATKKTAKKKK
jgi:hypothetical protein